MKLFLRIKHWQLFILLIGIPVLAEFLTLGSVFSSENFEDGMERFLNIFPILIGIILALLFSWLWMVGEALYRRLPVEVEMPIGLFRGALILPLFYIGFILWFLTKLFWTDEMSELFLLENIGLIITAHLISMVCILFVLYFDAKALRSVELGKRARFSDYVAEFFLFWFHPIGVWFLQPRINKISESMPENTDRKNLSEEEEGLI